MDDPHDLCPAFLSGPELLVLAEMSDGEYVTSAREAAADLGMTAKFVQATRRKIKDMGLAHTTVLVCEVDGKLCGWGTWLNRTGLVYRSVVRTAMWLDYFQHYRIAE